MKLQECEATYILCLLSELNRLHANAREAHQRKIQNLAKIARLLGSPQLFTEFCDSQWITGPVRLQVADYLAGIPCQCNLCRPDLIGKR